MILIIIELNGKRRYSRLKMYDITHNFLHSLYGPYYRIYVINTQPNPNGNLDLLVHYDYIN